MKVWLGQHCSILECQQVIRRSGNADHDASRGMGSIMDVIGSVVGMLNLEVRVKNLRPADVTRILPQPIQFSR